MPADIQNNPLSHWHKSQAGWFSGCEENIQTDSSFQSLKHYPYLLQEVAGEGKNVKQGGISKRWCDFSMFCEWMCWFCLENRKKIQGISNLSLLQLSVIEPKHTAMNFKHWAKTKFIVSHLANAFIQSNLQMRTIEAIKTNKRAILCKSRHSESSDTYLVNFIG